MAIFGRLAACRFKMKRKERKEKQIKIKIKGDKTNKREGEENRITYYFNTQSFKQIAPFQASGFDM